MPKKGIVPLYYVVMAHPNDGTVVPMPPSQFAIAEVASRTRQELTDLLAQINTRFLDGSNDLPFLKQAWEQDFRGQKAESAFTIADLEHAVKCELRPAARHVVYSGESIPSYNLVRQEAFGNGELETRKGMMKSASHHDQASLSIKAIQSGVGKEAGKYRDVTFRAPFLIEDGGEVFINPAYLADCTCRAHSKQVARDLRTPQRNTYLVCHHIAAGIRELYLEKERIVPIRIKGLSNRSLRGQRGAVLNPYNLHENPELALEAVVRRFVFGHKLSDIDRSLMDEDIFSTQYQDLRNSKPGQLRREVVQSTQNFPGVYGKIKEEMISALTEHGYEYLGNAISFRDTEYETVSKVFGNRHSGKMIHILYDPSVGINSPHFLLKLRPGQVDTQYGDPLNQLPDNPVACVNRPFLETDDMTGVDRVSLVKTPVSILTVNARKQLYTE